MTETTERASHTNTFSLLYLWVSSYRNRYKEARARVICTNVVARSYDRRAITTRQRRRRRRGWRWRRRRRRAHWKARVPLSGRPLGRGERTCVRLLTLPASHEESPSYLSASEHEEREREGRRTTARWRTGGPLALAPSSLLTYKFIRRLASVRAVLNACCFRTTGSMRKPLSQVT